MANDVKKRGWVKNAAIIFLLVMLVLTLFSNSIMNRSLAEVAVHNVQSGSINAKIRGTGTAEANNAYEVILQQTREIRSVLVKIGDQVEAGDTLFVLADNESEELQAAKDDLDAKVLAYRIALINAAAADYAKENKEVQRAQQKLQEAQNALSLNYVSAAEMSSAQSAVTELEREIADLQKELADLGEGNFDDAELAAAKTAMNEAKFNLDAHREAFRDEIDKVYSDRDGSELGAAATALEWSKLDDPVKQACAEAYFKETELLKIYSEAKVKYENLLDSDTSDEYERVNKKLRNAEDDLVEAKQRLEDLTKKQTAWETANENVDSLQQTLDDLIFGLAEQQKEDGKQQSIDQLNLAAQQKEIAALEKTISELVADSTGKEITANVAGVITQINVTAGGTTTPEAAIAVIEVPDMGYELSFAVTPEQAKRVSVGDQADVTNYYWGDPITATLVNIKPDPENPSGSKLLVFRLVGEVTSGSQFSLSIGEKSANYELLVPNSALRNDNNGDFVLIAVAKNTPLGTRYTATRVDVQILAKDDTNAAVSGGLVNWDYVITTSTKPVEAGQLVRLADN